MEGQKNTEEVKHKSVDGWLASYGFTRNPFATTDADKERDLLTESLFFIMPGYNEIESSGTVLVFAPPGGGKSTLRVRLAGLSLPREPESTTLSIEFTRFNWAVELLRTERSVTLGAYADQLLREAAAQLLESFMPGPEETKEGRQKRHQRIVGFSPVDRYEFALFLQRHNPGLFSFPSLYRLFERLIPNFEPPWETFMQALKCRDLSELLESDETANWPVVTLLSDLATMSSPGTLAADDFIASFEKMVTLARGAGIDQIQFLIDRVDELDFLSDPSMQVELLLPLLNSPSLLQMPGLAFKFMLNTELHPLLIKRVKHNRILRTASTFLQWDEHKLKQMLQNRLLFLSGERINSLTALASEKGASVEKDMIHLAEDSPRTLLLAGRLLFQSHIAIDGSQIFRRAAWQRARRQLAERLPGQISVELEVDLEQNQVLRNGEPIHLSPQARKLIKSLVDHGGYCDRDTLANEVWEPKIPGAISDQSIDQGISRLRGYLDDDADDPFYVETVRDSGFRLKNYRIIS